jgi:hypothetical protein
MRRRLLAGISVAILLAAGCAQDTAGPGKAANDPRQVPSLSVGDAGLAAQIEAELTCLYQNGLLPNEASSLGKFKSIKDQLAAGDVQGAIEETANLIAFIELKYSQYGGPATITCNPAVPGYVNPVSVELLKDTVIENLWAYVGLTGEVCEVQAGEERFCRTEDESGFVYFPENIFSQLTFVSVEANPPGLTQLQNLFDEYPNRIRIVTSGLSDFSDDNLYPIKPLVVVCFNDQVVPNDQSILSRLLLGSKHEDEFQFLPAADFSGYPAEVLQEAQNLCGPVPTQSAFSTGTKLGRFGNRLLELLLPTPLQARQGAMAFGGVGGSAEQFSDFGVVDPGLNAFGGVGGSAEQFSKTSLRTTAGTTRTKTGTTANATLDETNSTVVGEAGETETDAADLPSVKVVAPVSGVGIPGVVVTFALGDPTTAPYSQFPSSATLCSGQTTATTGSDGVATLPCLNFGTTVGYKNLQVTFDPTGVDPLACIVDPDTQACNNAIDVNFLVQTKPASPAKLVVIGSPGLTSAQAGVAMVPQPVLEVQDAFGNPASLTSDVTISSVTVTNQDGTSCGATCTLSSFTSTTNQATGRVTLSGLALGGVVGTTYKLTFTSGSWTPATALVAVTAAGAPSLIEAFLPSGGNYVGTFDALSPVSPNPTVRVRDAFTNNIAGANVSWARNDALAGGSISSAATVTDANGQSFVTWTLGDGSNSLSASLTGLPLVTAATFTATAAKFVLAACDPSGNQKKTALASYDAGISGYLGNLSILATANGSIRSAELAMSVTGQSSGTGGYVTDIRAYRASGTGKGVLIASGKPFNASNPSDQTLLIPGDNGNPALIRFNLTPVAGAAVSAGEKVIFEVQITAPSNRTFQVWYNTKTTVGTSCHESKVYGAGVTNFSTGAATRGVNFNIRNFIY